MKTSVEMDGYWGLHVNVVYLHHLMYNVFVSSGETDICLLSCLVILLDFKSVGGEDVYTGL